MRKIGVGVVGCGVISKAYMTAMKRFAQIELKAVADMRSGPAEERGREFGVLGTVFRPPKCLFGDSGDPFDLVLRHFDVIQG